ncbi:MAG: cyclic beta 1-2 glucan synthetase [Candidatus Omnitrophica bacterium]|nr:cyclic beta 1-2 glucan synthetase [Candidatus Omnitrophota bacterium]
MGLELVSHGDGRVDARGLSSFVAAYQTVKPLKLGELWAIPIMLRIALVENLRRVASRIALGRKDQDIAGYWADRIIKMAEKEPGNLVIEIADMAKSNPAISTAFVAELTRRLQGQSLALALPLSWLEMRLSEKGMRVEGLVQIESQQQAADQASIRNTIGSLRSMGAIDWREFVETMSVVEKVLRGDPNGAYANMDFLTRDQYRHVIERIAEKSGVSEKEAAIKAITLAGANASGRGADDRTAHVGFFLIDKGLSSFEKAMCVRLGPGEMIERVARRSPFFLYLSAIASITAVVTIFGLSRCYAEGASLPALLWLGIIIALCSSRFALALTNWFATVAVMPQAVARMDFSKGIPTEKRTLVVVPTLMRNKSGIDSLLEGIEVGYLANRDPNLFFGLLTDLYDAPHRTMPEDEGILEYARKGVETLNEKYSTGKKYIFSLFHRRRIWNAEENVWMAYERKRGKLSELNHLLRGKGYLVVGDAESLQNVKYVITLDTDTNMPLGSARELVGTMAHPLNRAVYDDKGKKVTEGYGILQPRMAMSMSSANRSWFVNLFGGEPGIDPYTQTVSDVYQDLFREGSFIGKGIYDVDVFTKLFDGRFPDNLILSHDLLEGCYARSGLVSDIQFFEEYPSSYMADVKRRHRWIRGDWQIAAWLLPMVPTSEGGWIKNPLSLISKWKIFDNIRRSLFPAAMTLLFLNGWFLSGSAAFWTLFGLGIMLVPQVTISAAGFLKKPKEMTFGGHMMSSLFGLVRQICQAIYMTIMLPYEAFFSVDAIRKSLIRMFITRKKMLEWVTSSDSKSSANTSFAGLYGSMWISPAIAVPAMVLLAVLKPELLPIPAVILISWSLSPAVAWWVSRVRPDRKTRFSETEKHFLRAVARRTWRFFEHFVGQESNWLPPDNYQEALLNMTIKRTSPTNIGMALLSNLAAYDLRYLSAAQLLDRTSKSFQAMEQLEKFRGHFYNWYDIRTLKPLDPRYISTVDSGNLLAAILVLKQGLLQLKGAKVVHEDLMHGIQDTAGMLVVAAAEARKVPPDLVETVKKIKEETGREVIGVEATRSALDRIASLAVDIISGWSDKTGDVSWWAVALRKQCVEMMNEMNSFMPWAGNKPPDSIWMNGTPGYEALLTVMRNEVEKIYAVSTLSELALMDVTGFRELAEKIVSFEMERDQAGIERDQWLRGMSKRIDDAAARAGERISLIDRLALECGDLASLEFDFIYDKAYNLLNIGYNVTERRADASFYDLLASESRLTSFTGIALGRISEDHWFALGRLLTSWKNGEPALLSWGGSMFEYLMPLLIMPTYDNTLLDRTYRSAVAKQIEYAASRGIPWGISESGYNTTDAQMNYQYRAFGVPDLGFKLGLADDLVIAPYASVMALMVCPAKACANMERMMSEGFLGKYGFYEAVDYTPSRLPHGQIKPAIVRSFMAHHEGMSLLSLLYALKDRPMQQRFLADPMFQATVLLLQERAAKSMPFHPHSTESISAIRTSDEREALVRVFTSPNTHIPEVHLLSNGRYSVMVTNSGGGYSKWNNLAITRWSADTTRDDMGSFCYIRDTGSGEIWSAGYQPLCKMPKHYEAIFSQGKAEFKQKHRDIDTHTEIAVSPEDDIELRRVIVKNGSRYRKVIELTSYAEVVLAPPASDAVHPAFSKLFIQTEIVGAKQAILCTRRKLAKDDPLPYMFHLVAIHGRVEGEVSYETDRARFIGRGNDLLGAEAMRSPGRLSDTEGSVLDPITSTRCRVALEPDEIATLDFVTGIAETREKAMELIEKYRDRNLADRVFDLAWTHGQVVQQHFNVTEADVQLFRRLASSIIYPSNVRRASQGVMINNRRGQSGLWGYSISGDLPISLVRISDEANIDLVRQMLNAHAYWRMKGLEVDLIIWNEEHSGYRQELQDKIIGLISSGTEAHFYEKPGGIFVKRTDLISEEDKVLMQTVARVIVSDTRGTLAEQIDHRGVPELNIPRLSKIKNNPQTVLSAGGQAKNDLLFFNGIGGFTRDGREYVITVERGLTTPAPWVNVIANPEFGTVISENGGSYTWCVNSGMFRLTPWYNDPVTDKSGEALYVRDEETGRVWSPSPHPAHGATPYVVRHGFGYTVFEHSEEGIKTELWVYVSIDAFVKFSVLKIKNSSGRARKLSVSSYIEPVLGETRSKTQMHVISEIDPKTGAFFIRNFYNADFGEYVTFLDVNQPVWTATGDRTEFVGRNGRVSTPWAMSRTRLSNRVGAGFDPCAAIRAEFELADGEDKEVVFTLGCGKNTDNARELVDRYRGSGAARAALEGVWGHWKHTLGAVNIDTPDDSLNVLANGWLLYQTISCRMWARGAFYQSGGAFGFRDQLQDVMALVYAEPALCREHILSAASRQFKEGDVQHWWHPPHGVGVRTRISDDLLWLPLAVSAYVRTTGDTGILDEKVRFLKGRLVKPEEDAYYEQPVWSEESATLYEHCLKALRKGLTSGEHGLPLMGTGDWNDGMNLVGSGGKGESVWLAFFISHVLGEFAMISSSRGDVVLSKMWKDERDRIKKNIEKETWDGNWYLRAYFDNGSRLGAASNEECQIDSIPQSWAVISSAGRVDRARTAMDEVARRLVDRDSELIKLFGPPFDVSEMDPGYIKGYVPGVRENGGQYTHAALWVVIAFAMLGNTEKAWELFNLINPVKHGSSASKIAVYKVEPYVVAADVYAVPPHAGRGGWTWYTGSAGWMYRLIIENLLGLRLEGDKLWFKPCLAADWKSFAVHYRYRETIHHINFRRTGPGQEVKRVEVDGSDQEDMIVHLIDDRREHTAFVELG